MARSRFQLRLLLLAASATALAGCTQTKLHQSKDFGRNLAFDLDQQIPHPVPQYAGVPAPGSNGQRVGLAQERYVRDSIIPPATLGSSKVGADMAPPPTAYTPTDK